MEVSNAQCSQQKMAKSLFRSGTSSVNLKTMDEVLEQLAIAARQHPRQTEERQLAITELVNEILRSRPLCRPLGAQPLCSIQAEIYEQVRQQLLSEIDREVDKYKPERFGARVWTNTLRDRAFRQVLDDARLKQLALEIQQLSPQTELRQHLLGELIKAIRLSDKLCRPHRQKFAPAFYELLYEEAVNETLLYVCQNIDKYDPQRGRDKKFITWVNFHLDKLVIECRRKFGNLETNFFASLADIEKIEIPEAPSLLSDLIREYIEEDAENLFRQAQIENQPRANFRAIALARFAGKSWEEISAELGIAVPTLSSFYRRCCQKFASKFKADLQS
jgi:DNA-directed RNA polymerase specialized sigma24 family protein